MAALLKKCILAGAILSAVSFGVHAQQRKDWAIKTNLLHDAVLVANAGIEHQIANRWSLDLSGDLNAWTIKDRKWRQWRVQPEARYWFCEAIGGHFIALHALGGEFNIGNLDLDFKFLGTDFSRLKNNRYEGWYAGAGIAYGYSWILSRHWNMEAEIGFGWVYSKYDVYPCAVCGHKSESGSVHHYVGPTKIALDLVYVF